MTGSSWLLWWRVMVSRPTLAAFVAVATTLLLLGGRTLPVVGDAGDARILWYGGSALGTLAAQVVTPRGPIWQPWRRDNSALRLLVWGAMVLTASVAAFAGVLALHDAPWPNAMGVFLICWGGSVTLWRRGFDLAAPMVPFGLVVVLQITAAFVPALGGIFDERGRTLLLILGIAVASIALATPPKQADLGGQ